MPRDERRSFWQSENPKYVVFLLLGVGALLVAYFAIAHGSKAGVSLGLPGGGSLKVTPSNELRIPSKEASGLDPKRNFIDSALGFKFKRPEGSGWSFTRASGIEAVFKARGTSIKLGSATSPIERMFRDVEWVRMSSGPTLRVSFTPRSTITVLGQTVPLGKIPSFLAKGINFGDGLEVTAFDKRKLRGQPLSLPTFYGLAASLFDLNLDKLAAGEGSILGSASFRFGNAMIGERPSNLSIDRAFLFAESSTHFYIAEIAYSPQTNEPLSRWDALEDALNSFKLIDAA